MPTQIFFEELQSVLQGRQRLEIRGEGPEIKAFLLVYKDYGRSKADLKLAVFFENEIF